MGFRRAVRDLLPRRVLEAYWKLNSAPSTGSGRPQLLAKYMDSYNVVVVSEFLAALDSARFYERELLTCTTADNDLHLLELALSWRQVDGLIMEFGVASGRTINHLAKTVPTSRIFGFDWFRGLPEGWRTGFPKGSFNQAIPAVSENVTLIDGLFDESLPPFVANHSEVASLLHIDCDLYSSTKTILDSLSNRIVPGTVIVFDEFFNYPGWRQHEYRAFNEFVRTFERKFEYLGFVPRHQQVCVRMVG